MADALASFAGADMVAAQIARNARETGRLLLIGMGGSHFVNRVAEPVYRSLGPRYHAPWSPPRSWPRLCPICRARRS